MRSRAATRDPAANAYFQYELVRGGERGPRMSIRLNRSTESLTAINVWCMAAELNRMKKEIQDALRDELEEPIWS